MMKNTLLRATLIGVTALSLGGCIRGGSKNETQVSTTTTGQELTDLQTAYENGVITAEEYEKKKKEILKRD